jgi:hypothetical protein
VRVCVGGELLKPGVGVGRYDEEKEGGMHATMLDRRVTHTLSLLSLSLSPPPARPPLSPSLPPSLSPFLPLTLLTAWQGCPAGGVGDREPYEEGRYSRSMFVCVCVEIYYACCVYLYPHTSTTRPHVRVCGMHTLYIFVKNKK